MIRALIVSLWFAVVTAGAAMADSYNQTETPHYTIALADGAIELRDYAPRLMAEVTVQGSRSQAANAGFRVLAGYIFGGNMGAARIDMTTPVAQAPAPVKIAMTTPVTQVPSAEGWVVQFMMPSGYTLDSLPKARDSAIRFVKLPAERMAVVRFSGLADAGTWEARQKALLAWIAARGLTVVEGPRFFRYDPPWTLPWDRRNEVAFVVR